MSAAVLNFAAPVETGMSGLGKPVKVRAKAKEIQRRVQNANVLHGLCSACSFLLSISCGSWVMTKVSAYKFTQLSEFGGAANLFYVHVYGGAAVQFIAMILSLIHYWKPDAVSVGVILIPTVVLRAISVCLGFMVVYTVSNNKWTYIQQIADNWENDRFRLVVAGVSSEFECCGWEMATETCRIKKCGTLVSKAIQGIIENFTWCSFVVSLTTMIMIVYLCLAVALGVFDVIGKDDNIPAKKTEE